MLNSRTFTAFIPNTVNLQTMTAIIFGLGMLTLIALFFAALAATLYVLHLTLDTLYLVWDQLATLYTTGASPVKLAIWLAGVFILWYLSPRIAKLVCRLSSC